jgi:hypothetical protein
LTFSRRYSTGARCSRNWERREWAKQGMNLLKILPLLFSRLSARTA